MEKVKELAQRLKNYMNGITVGNAKESQPLFTSAVISQERSAPPRPCEFGLRYAAPRRNRRSEGTRLHASTDDYLPSLEGSPAPPTISSAPPAPPSNLPTSSAHSPKDNGADVVDCDNNNGCSKKK